jgi:tRNA pseudouridine55 synthase
VGEVAFGTETDTLDAAGTVTATYDMGEVTVADVEAVAGRFRGDILQVPPMVSALKVDGKRLHQLAREGIEVERQPRPVTISHLEILPGPPGEANVVTVAVTCSSGTYIRTLAADLGTALGGGAHLRTLRRTSVGPFTLDDAVPLEAVAPEVLRPLADAVRHLDAVVVDDDGAAAVAVGKVLERDVLGADGDGPWAVLGPDGALLAVYEPFRGTTAKPSVVISTGGGGAAG